MSQFLDRNKKKGGLAALLLFLKRGKGLGPFLAMAVILGGLFVVPAGFSESPWLLAWVERLGLSGLLGGSKGEEGMGFSEAMASARRGRDSAESISNLRSLPPPGPSFNRSSVAMVQEKQAPLQEEAIAEKIVDSGGKTVDGVLNPDDAKKVPEGVALKEDELHRALNGQGGAAALAASRGSDFWGSGGSGGSASGGGFGAGRADDKGASLVAAAMDNSKVPGVGPDGSRGRLELGQSRRPKTNLAGGADPARINGKSSAMNQLAQGRAFSVAAAPPPGYCPPGSCPNEFASNASGITFDGKRQPTSGILGSPEFGDPSVPVTPGMDSIGTLADQADQTQRDAERCQAAQREHGPAERAKAKEIQETSDQMNNLNCNSGGCGGNVSQCKALGDKIKRLCTEDNALLQKIAEGCSAYTGGISNQRDCN